MKTQIALTIALLLAPCDAVKLQSRAAFPKIPVAGKDVANALAGALEEGKRELSRAMYSKEKNCWGGKNPDDKI